jgi:hypothetical protein
MVTIKSIEAQQDKGIGVRVNHVGIYVKNLQESVDFYTRTLGMREGFVMRDKSGNPTTMYVQVDKYTFLEPKTSAILLRSCANAASPCPNLLLLAAEHLTQASAIRTECAWRCLNSLQGRCSAARLKLTSNRFA